MKFIRIAGLYIFIASVLLFIATLFMGNYTLSETSIQQSFSGKDAKVIENFTATAKENGVLNNTYNNPFSFMSDVQGLFNKHNTRISNSVLLQRPLKVEKSRIQKIFCNKTYRKQK